MLELLVARLESWIRVAGDIGEQYVMVDSLVIAMDRQQEIIKCRIPIWQQFIHYLPFVTLTAPLWN